MNDTVHPHGGHDHLHDDHHDAHSHGSFGSYMIGFGLSVILTAIPFWLVMSGALHDPQLTGIVIMGFAAVQVVVHMIYFLHVNTRVEGGWSFMAMMLTVVLVVIVLSGSLWVMYHLNANMMPHAQMEMDMGPTQEMRVMQNMSEMP